MSRSLIFLEREPGLTVEVRHSDEGNGATHIEPTQFDLHEPEGLIGLLSSPPFTEAVSGFITELAEEGTLSDSPQSELTQPESAKQETAASGRRVVRLRQLIRERMARREGPLFYAVLAIAVLRTITQMFEQGKATEVILTE